MATADSNKAAVLARLYADADNVASELLERFDWIGLPRDTSQIEELHVELSNAIVKALEDWA